MKHTKGPWKYYEIMGYCVVYPHEYLRTEGTHLIEYTEPCSELKANAKLIAAAPELLEACKIAFKIEDTMYTTRTSFYYQLEIAINKAEGK